MGMSLGARFRLPEIANPPFCPSEVQGSIDIDKTSSPRRKLFQFLGPALLVSVGYMDPGNWATDIEAGSKYGYTLLWVVLFSSISAMFLQILSARLGLVTGKDLAVHCREQMSPWRARLMWLVAELAIIATDLAEVLGGALALHLLLGVSVANGVLLTALDTFIVLGLTGKGFRTIEAVIFGLVATIGIGFAFELWVSKPDLHGVAAGLIPNSTIFTDREALYIAIGILGATVMPHNLFLHSAIVQTRKVAKADLSQAVRLTTVDTVSSLSLAFLVNAAILVLAASAFFGKTSEPVTEIDTAYRLLDPLLGSQAASFVFAIALLAAGQSSTFTGTIAGQVLLEGFLELKMPCWKRRVITRGLALVPAYLGVLALGEGAVGKLLVLSQVVLSLQLPFTMYPLIRYSSRKDLLQNFSLSKRTKTLAWMLFLAISAANFWLVVQVF